MNWKEIFKPTFWKIILSIILLLLFTLIFGVPVSKFVLCEPCPPAESGLPCTPCPKIMEFRSILNLIKSQEFIGKGIFLAWYVYIMELILSYLASSAIIYLLKTRKKT